MKIKSNISIIVLISILVSCSYNTTKIGFNKNSLKLIVNDTILNTNLSKKYRNESKKNTNKSIVVAVLDTQIDLEHEDLKDAIWINKNEIPNNNIDDDKNGYIDDINGWNFIGKPNGGYFRYWNFEYVRVVKKWGKYFKNKTKVSKDSLELFEEYNRAIKLYEAKNKYYKNWLKSLEFQIKVRPKIDDTIKHFFPKGNYTIAQLDSLYLKYKINDKKFRQRRDDNDMDLGALIFYLKSSLEVGNTKLEDLINSKNQLDSVANRNLNSELDDRRYINDNPERLEKGYGNNILNSNKFQLNHSTSVSSIIAGRRNNKGINGFSNNIKIMPLTISTSGDENDKDIAMAIKYAVDNGAKVINMSFGKEFSLNQDWVTEAFKYAEEKSVLLIHCSGNDGFDNDTNRYYPSDVNYIDKKEIVTNFVNVGSVTKNIDSTLVSNFSNYGKENVDIFALGSDVPIAKPNNTYGYDSGTSLAGPMVSGTAALIWLYYPNLSVQEVKQIILDSGTAYELDVIVPGTKDKKVKFSELSKSGKVLNVYNAMKMAKKMSKKKKE